MLRQLPLLLMVLLVACGRGGGVLNVHEVEGGTPPPTDAFLVEARWPDAAAWIARATDAGHPVVVNVFAAWCAPCRYEMPLLVEAAGQHDDVTFLGVDHLDFRDNGRAFVEEFDVSFPTLFDPAGIIAPSMGGRGMPVTAFFHRDGTLAHVHTGPVTRPLLDEWLAAIR